MHPQRIQHENAYFITLSLDTTHPENIERTLLYGIQGPLLLT